jgi:MFS family permease
MSRQGEVVRYRDLFASREFTALVFAQVVSGLGDQVARVALALLVLDRSGSASLSAAAFALSYIPLVFGGTILGPLADRFARHKVLLSSDALRVITVGLLAVFATDSSPLIVLFALLFVAEIFTPVFDAAWAATLPDVFPQVRQYLAGSGLLRTLHLLQQVAGLAIGGLAVALISVQGALIADAASFAVSFVILFLFLKRRENPRSGRSAQSLFADFSAGARDLFADPARRILVFVGWGSVLIMITPMAVALPYAQQVAGKAALGSLLMAATVGGAAVGSVFIARRDPRWQVEAIVPLSVIACLPLLAVCVAPPLPIALILWALSGAATGFLVPLIGTLALLTAPHMRGRVLALAGAGYNALVAMTYLMAGVLADVSKPSVAITIAGAAGLGLIGVVQIFWPTSAMRAALDQAYATNGYEQDPSASDTQERASAGERELVPEKALPPPTSAPPETFPSGDFWDAFRP